MNQLTLLHINTQLMFIFHVELRVIIMKLMQNIYPSHDEIIPVIIKFVMAEI